MTLTTAQQVRLRIQDQYRYAEEEFFGDGVRDTFKLAQGAPHSTVTAASAYVRLATGYSGTGATFNTSLGTLQFSATISANSAVKAVYQWSVFSDDEVTQFLSDGGSVNGAALQAIHALMFDSLKRARWSAPDGSSYDDTAAMRQLNEMYDRLWKLLREEPSGGIEAWSEQQAYFAGSEYPS